MIMNRTRTVARNMKVVSALSGTGAAATASAAAGAASCAKATTGAKKAAAAAPARTSVLERVSDDI